MRVPFVQRMAVRSEKIQNVDNLPSPVRAKLDRRQALLQVVRQGETAGFHAKSTLTPTTTRFETAYKDLMTSK